MMKKFTEYTNITTIQMIHSEHSSYKITEVHRVRKHGSDDHRMAAMFLGMVGMIHGIFTNSWCYALLYSSLD